MTVATHSEVKASGINAAIASGALPTGSELPADFDPRKDGMLMAHQVEWIADKSPLKIAVKCRRSGFTFAEAMMDTIIAATARGEGGDNVFYIGDTQEKGREFINYCAHFARVIAGEVLKIDEVVFADQREDGSTASIAAFRIKFASGFSIVALSSRPENIRGLQGVVVIDEAAFHKDVGEVIDAAMALLMWGGKIRIISTHNGKLNKFNELVTKTKAGKTKFSLHSITFDEVVANGLYERVKFTTPDIMPFDEWYETIRGGYVSDARMREELDIIPRDSEGAALARVQVEACADRTVPVIRLAKPEAFSSYPEDARAREIDDWLRETLAPVLAELNINARTLIGADVARRGHATVFWLSQIEAGLVRRSKLVVELRKLPFAQLRQVLFYILDRAGRRWSASIDASGLGMQMAEEAGDKYGSRVAQVTFATAFYSEFGVKLVSNVQDLSVTIPFDEDITSDFCALAFVNGVVKIPDKHETVGADGGKRHADGAVAAMLVEHAAGAEPADINGLQTAGNQLTAADGFRSFGQDNRQTQVGAGSDVGWGVVPIDISFEGWG